MEQMNIGGREYPITGTVEHEVLGAVPIVDLENPEAYREMFGEDVEAVIDQLRATIAEYEKAVGREASA